MSGHSKFANIKHKKEKNDAAKGKIFTIIGREIAVAVKEGGPDPASNSKLRDIIAKAKSNNMPNDTIERGIKKAAGDADSVNYVSVSYEGYGPNGTAIIVDALTDNKNRTAANVRNAFTKGGGNVGTQGCVSFMFDEKGLIVIDKEEVEMDEKVYLEPYVFSRCKSLKKTKAKYCNEGTFSFCESLKEFSSLSFLLGKETIIDTIIFGL